MSPRAVTGILALAVMVAGCASAGSPTPAPSDGRYDIGDGSLFLECTGSSAPTVVLEAGLGENHGTWSRFEQVLGDATRVCAYDRAGRGTSDPADAPRTAGDAVDDLVRLLDVAGIQRPVVLVGHSFGGVVAQLFAARAPSDVAGLVLVDPTPGTFREDMCSVVDEAACSALTSQLAPAGNPEGMDWPASVAELAAAGPIGDVPIIVLAATNHGQGSVAAAVELWRGRLRELADSATRGTFQLVESGHFIHLDKPDVVAEAIRSVIASAAAGSAAPSTP